MKTTTVFYGPPYKIDEIVTEIRAHEAEDKAVRQIIPVQTYSPSDLEGSTWTDISLIVVYELDPTQGRK